MASIALGLIGPDGREPALNAATPPPLCMRANASAIWLRLEFSTQTNTIRAIGDVDSLMMASARASVGSNPVLERNGKETPPTTPRGGGESGKPKGRQNPTPPPPAPTPRGDSKPPQKTARQTPPPGAPPPPPATPAISPRSFGPTEKLRITNIRMQV